MYYIYSLGPVNHLSYIKTLNLFNQTYQWLGILQFIITFIKDYAFYFYIKTLYLIPPGFLKLLKLLVCLWANIFINYIVNLLKCLYNGKIYKYIFIIVDRLIKIKYFIFITSLNIEELVKVFIYTIYKLYSTSSTIISNRDSLFIFNFQCCLNLLVTQSNITQLRFVDSIIIVYFIQEKGKEGRGA